MMRLRLLWYVIKQKLCRHREQQGDASPIAQCVKCGRVRYAGYKGVNISDYLGG